MKKDPLLPSDLTIYNVAELHKQWLSLVDKVPSVRASTRTRDCRMDGSSVTEVDAAGVQMLLALANSLSRKNRTLRLVKSSERLMEACKALGVAALLRDSDQGK